jgi:multicomponent Na+:H+ antiporter subunit F
MSLPWTESIVLALLAAAAVLGMVRLWLGPHAPDRVVAADTLSVIATGAIVVLAMLFDAAIFLDVALLYGVLAFVGIVALARAIEEDSP